MKFILSEIKKRPFDHLLLIVACFFALVLIFFFSGNPHSQRRVIYGLTAFYFLWSLHYHYRRGDLSASIITEYLLMAIFALLLVTTTLF